MLAVWPGEAKHIPGRVDLQEASSRGLPGLLLSQRKRALPLMSERRLARVA